MKRLLTFGLCLLAAAFTTQAQIIVEDSFDTHADGDLNGQGDWATSTNGAYVVAADEVNLAIDNSRLVLAGDNAFDLLPGDTVEITIDHRVHMPVPEGPVNFSLLQAGIQATTNVAGVGLSDSVSCRVSYNNWANGSINYHPDDDQWWASGQPKFRADVYDHCGFDHKPTVGATADPDSDPLRMVYTLTKSHVTNEFSASLEFSNLATNISGIVSKGVLTRADAWASSNLTFFVNSLDNANGPNMPYLDSVKVEKVAPSAAPATVSALGLQGQVLLSWDAAIGASEYDVLRSTTSGVFNDPATRVSGESYEDNTVVNGTTYYYVVRAVYYNGVSGNSPEASAQPRDVYKDELVILSDFSGETAGDLAGQIPWAAISGSGPNAFNVIAGPPTAADTVSTEANFALTNGNAVVVDRTLSNEKDDAIEGWIDVVVSSTPSNGVEGAFADMGNQAVLDFGLTGNNTDALRAEGEAIMALLTLHIRFEGNMFVSFGTTQNDNPNNRLAYIDRDDAGWNPNDKAWDFPGGPADLVTDPLRVSFKIRKTRDVGVYQAWASISNLSSGVVSTFEGPEYMTINRADVYDMPATLFALGHSDRAREIQNGSRVRDSMHHVTVNEVSVTHTVGNTPVVLPPTVTSLTRGDREVSFTWDSVLDATGGYTIKLETPEGEMYTVADGITETSYTDSPRWNDIVNTYTLQANFDSDLTPDVASTNFDAAPVGLIPVYSIGPGEWTSGGDVQVELTGLTTNGGIRYVDYLTTPVFENGVDGYTGPTLYGLFQGMSSGTSMNIQTSPDKTMYNHGGWGNWGEHLSFATLADMGYEPGSINPNESSMYFYVKAGSWSFGEWNFAFHAAIRDGEQWYVSATSHARGVGGGGGGDKPLLFPDVAQEIWVPLTVSPGTEMGMGVGIPGTSLTDVNAVGWFTDQLVNSQIWELEVKVSGALPSYDYWADSMGLVSTNSARTDDPDEDDLINEQEFAFGGDPLEADTATLPELSTAVWVDPDTSDEYITYVYQKQRDPGAGFNYLFKTTTDLVAGDANSNYGVWSTNNHVEVEAILDYHWMTVTNFVPYGDGIDQTIVELEID